MHDLTTPEGVKAQMESSTTREEWDSNCDAVKAANKGYPQFWYALIVASGLLSRISSKWD